MRRLLMFWCGIVLAACGGTAEQNNTANQLYYRADYDDAILRYYDAQVDAYDNALLYFNASAPLFDEGEFDQALATLDQALKSDDENLIAKAYHNIGNIYFQQGMYTEAIVAYRQSLLINPDDQDTRYNLELAMFFELPPTPTALEQKIEPVQDDTDPDATPTPNPGGNDDPSPTPPLEAPPDPTQPPEIGFTGDMTGPTPSTPLPRTDATLTIEEAMRQLDSVEQDQRTLREFQEDILTPQATLSGKDW